MRIYNGKNSVINVPLGNQRITVPAHSISSNFMPSTDFIRTMAVSFDVNEIALVVVGAWEGNMCAGVPAVQPLCVSSLDEALARFNSPLAEKKEDEPKKAPEKKEEVKKVEVKEEPKPEEPKVVVETKEEVIKEEPVVEVPEVKEELPAEEAEEKKEEPKKTRKTRSTGKKASSKKTKKS